MTTIKKEMFSKFYSRGVHKRFDPFFEGEDLIENYKALDSYTALFDDDDTFEFLEIFDHYVGLIKESLKPKNSRNYSTKEKTRYDFPYDATWWCLIKSKWQEIVSSLFSKDSDIISVYFGSKTSYSLTSKVRAKCTYFQQHLIEKPLYEGMKWNPASKLTKGELIILKKQVLAELGYTFNDNDSIEDILKSLSLSEDSKRTFETAFTKAKKESESEGSFALTGSKKAVIFKDAIVENLIKSLDLYEFQVNHGLELWYLLYLTLGEVFTQSTWSQKMMVMKPSKWTKELFSDSDHTWLSGQDKESVYSKERTVNFSIDKDQLSKVYMELKDAGNVTNFPYCNIDSKEVKSDDFDIEGIFALLQFLTEASDLSKSNLQTLLKSLGVKPVEMLGDNALKNKTTPNKNTNSKAPVFTQKDPS